MARQLRVDAVAETFGVSAAQVKKRSRRTPIRAVAARYLIRYAGLTQREVAKVLDAGSGSAVSKQLTRYSELLTTDKRVIKLLRKIERNLDAQRDANT